MDVSQKLTVSELTGRIQANLERAFPSLVVEGELSNCRPSSTGHLYFTLKDAGAAISGVMFKNRYRGLGFEPRDGMLLRVRGSLEVYAQRGSYQIVCEEMEEAGSGDILALLEQRKRRLAAEGLFDADRKRPLPRFPETVGVITSPAGAAVRDILTVLRRRAPGVRVVVLPAPVQGEEAAALMVRRIEQANRWNLAEVLILSRGGGSLEDLLPFSDEALVRAAAGSAIPLISAVGHEIDWALSDFAADLRAPTPSAAAELVSAHWGELGETVRRTAAALVQDVRGRLDRARLLVRPFNLEDLEYRIRNMLQPRLMRFDDAKEGLLSALGGRLQELRRRTELARTGLEAASPPSALERGFSVVLSRKTGRVIRRFSDVAAGEGLTIRPLEGLIRATTEAVYPSSRPVEEL